MQQLPALKDFSLECEKIFDEAYSALKFPLGEHNFVWIFLSAPCYKDIQWMEINGNFCLFVTFEGRRIVLGPALPGKRLADTLKECFMLCDSYNRLHGTRKSSEMLYIPEELKEEYENLEGFKLTEQNNDFIYRTKEIIELKGNKYKDKRNKRNYFMTNYSFLVEDYSESAHKEGCIKLLQQWQNQRSPLSIGENKKKIEYDAQCNRMTFDYAEILGLKGMVVKVDERVEGYIFGQKMNEKICKMFFGKTNLEIKGLSQFIFSEFLKRYFAGTDFVNDGEDWGVIYLERSKLSYMPAIIKKGYKLVSLR